MEKDLQQTTTWLSEVWFSHTRMSIRQHGFSDNHTTENQIDHQKFGHSLLDVKVKRGADAGSDHHLVIARTQLNT